MNKLLSILSITSLSLMALPGCAAKSGDVHGDWGVRCETNDQEQEGCFIFQNLNTKGDGQRVLQASASYPSGQESGVLMFTTLLGINLLPGVQFQIDQGEPRKIPVAVCDAEGCKAFVQLDTELLAELKQGNKLKFTFANMQRQAYNVEVSLKGFTAGITAVKR